MAGKKTKKISGPKALPVVDVNAATQTGRDPAEVKSPPRFRFIKNLNPLQPVPLPDGSKVVFPNREYFTDDAAQAAHLRSVAGEYGLIEG
jgi:hypothetical protein